jgi:MarR family transcriptional regulator, organic hydroperoxide resistance regulator
MAATPTASPKASAVEPDPGPSPELAALGLAFRRLFRAVSRMRGRDTHLAGGELSHAQFELLIELDERGELSVGELALAARVSPASVTQMLDGLLESGYVERARSDSDRRVVLASLTPLGGARVEAKRAAWKERWERVLADVSPREMRAATKVLERLGEMFDQAPEDAACDGPDGGVQSSSQSQ